jgi:lysophospholipase L1-like esterase
LIPSIRRLAAISIVVALSGAASLVIVDLALRAIGYWPPISQPWHLDKPSARIPSDTLIMARADLLRDDFYSVNPALSTIVTLGDSFTEGFGVGRSRGYPAKLRDLLARQGWHVNVLNVGVGNTGTDQQLRILKELVLPRVRPAIVVWQLYQNDIADNVQQAVYGIERGTLIPWSAHLHWMYLRRKLYDAVPLPASIKERSPLLRLSYRALEAIGDRRVPRGDEARREWSGVKVRLAIEELERLAETGGFKTYYVLVAPQGRYLEDSETIGIAMAWSEASKRAHELLETLLAGRADFVDGWFGDTATWPGDISAKRVRTSAGLGVELFVDESVDPGPLGHRHFNETGYSLLAHAISARLLDDR